VLVREEYYTRLDLAASLRASALFPFSCGAMPDFSPYSGLGFALDA
jgi:hypothetical protein